MKKNMAQFENQAAQGDLLIRRIEEIPADAVKQKPTGGQHVVAHSETGHHHVVPAKGVDFFHAANDPMIVYLVIKKEAVALTHLRSFDTHRPLECKPGNYEIRRQREHTPEGWRRVAD